MEAHLVAFSLITLDRNSTGLEWPLNKSGLGICQIFYHLYTLATYLLTLCENTLSFQVVMSNMSLRTIVVRFDLLHEGGVGVVA